VKKFIFLYSLLGMMVLSSCNTSKHTFSSTLEASDEGVEEIKDVIREDFRYDNDTNAYLYSEKEEEQEYNYIDVSLPVFIVDDRTKVLDSILVDINNFKRNNDKNQLEISFDAYRLTDDIINVVLTKKETVGDVSKNISKTLLYNRNEKQFIDVKFDESELVALSDYVKNTFKEKEYNSKIENFESVFYPNTDFYKNFVMVNENEFVFYFNDFVLDENNNSETITAEVPAKLLRKSFKNSSAEVFNAYEDFFNEGRKYIALTFDDGPHPEYTETLLQYLEELDIKATFFLVGYAIDKSPEIVNKIKEGGHEIGNHTYGHKDLRRLGWEDIVNQIDYTNNQIFELTGERPNLVRAPYGSHDQRVVDISRELEMSLIFWNVDPADWNYRDIDSITQNIFDNTEDGSIILLHDLFETTVESVKYFVPTMIENGYEFVTVSELVEKNGAVKEIVVGEKYYSVAKGE